MARESIAHVYLNRRMLVLVGLGFASGLPSQWSMLGSTVQSWLTDYNIDIATIGLFGLIGVPFLFNFAWAPLLDKFKPPLLRRLGRRRGWLVWIQLALLIAIVTMGLFGPTSADDSLLPFAVAGLLVALFAATQDVVADAYRTDVLEDEELGVGAAVFVNGYRFAMLAAGGGAIYLSEKLPVWFPGIEHPWRVAFLMLAALMAVGLAATLLAKPSPSQESPASLYEAVVEPAEDFFLRKGMRGLAVLAFVVLFKLPDNLTRAMTVPLLQGELGIDKEAIAWVKEGLGLAIYVASTMAGGGVLAKLGVYRSLWVFGILQAVSNLGFMVLALLGTSSVPALTIVVAIENVCGGFVTAGFVAFLMSQCNRRYSATQYALFTSLMAGGALVTSGISGFLVEALAGSFAAFFFVSVLAAAPGLALLYVLGPTIGRTSEAHDDAVQRRSVIKVLGIAIAFLGLTVFTAGLWGLKGVIEYPAIRAEASHALLVLGGEMLLIGAAVWLIDEMSLRLTQIDATQNSDG